MVRHLAIVGAVMLAGCSPSAPAKVPDAGATAAAGDAALARVASRVGKDGAAAYVAKVGDEDADWQHLLARLSAGDPAAVSLAARLRPAADAGHAEALDTAAARGLAVAPVPILTLTRAGARVDALCTSPFIEPEAGVERRYNMAARAALDAVPVAQRVQPAFDECRRALEKIGATLPG